VKLALLIGNRYTPWHFRGYRRLRGAPEITVFRAESEIQRRFDERDDEEAPFHFAPIHFDTQQGPASFLHALRERYTGREPRIRPFAERLQGFDVIQSWELFTGWTAEAIEARRRFGVPLSLMVWDNIPFNNEQTEERRAIKRRALRETDRFIVHTERSRRMLIIEGAEEGRIVYVPPGVDTDLFSPGPSERAAFGLDDGDFVIFFAGWFLPRKGLDFLLLAMRELITRGSNSRPIKLLMVGSGPGRERIEASIARLGIAAHCVFAGSLPYRRMPAAFRSTDAFVLPSIATPEWQEQFGMSLIEAMACGAPVIGALSGAIPEIVGDAGLLCQPNDFVSLSDALRRLLESDTLRGELSTAGRKRVLDHFTLDRFSNALSLLYEEIA